MAATVLTTWMVVSVVEYFSGGIAAKIWKKHLWNYEDVTLFGGKKKSVLLSLIKAAVVMTAVLLLHPPVFILFSMIPTIVLRIIDIVGFGLMAADLVSILIAVRKAGADRAEGNPGETSAGTKGSQAKAWRQDLSCSLEAVKPCIPGDGSSGGGRSGRTICLCKRRLCG